MNGLKVAKALGGAQVLLFDVIGDETTSLAFAKELKALGNVRQIDLKINSPGGNVFESMGIYDTLRSHPARVVVDIVGCAMSGASLIAMAGDEIRMAASAIMMIHEASMTMFSAYRKDMEDMAAALAKLNAGMAKIYAARTGQSEAKIQAMMAAETYMDAQEAKALGFCDTISKPLRVAANFQGLNVPERFKHLAAAQNSGQFSRHAIANAQVEFADMVRAEMAAGLDRVAAVARVAERNPELHQAYLLATNASKPGALRQIDPNAGRLSRKEADEGRHEFLQRVTAAVDAGMERFDAIEKIAREHRELHQAYLQATCPGNY